MEIILLLYNIKNKYKYERVYSIKYYINFEFQLLYMVNLIIKTKMAPHSLVTGVNFQ